MARKALVPLLGGEAPTHASVVFAAARLSDEARDRLGAGENPRCFLEALLAQGKTAEVLYCLSRALPKKYCLAWVCECLKRTDGVATKFSEVDRAGLTLAESWLADPSEEKRVDAAEFAQKDGFRSVGGWLAAAAGWMGGSLGPTGQAAVPPPESLPGEAAVAALMSYACLSPATQKLQLAQYARLALRHFGGPLDHETP